MSEGAHPLRLALLCRGGHGGSTVAATELAAALARRGHEVDLFAPVALGRPPARPGRGLRVHEVPGGSRDLEEAVRVRAGARGYDAVHAHYARPLALRAATIADRLSATTDRPTTVVTLHGTDLTAVLDPRATPRLAAELVAALEVIDQVVCVSHDLAARSRLLPGLRTPPKVIHGGIDLVTWRRRGVAQRPELLSVSTLKSLKRIPALVDAFARARAGGAPRDLVLRIVGDGPDLALARDRARALGVSDAVVFEGACPATPALYRGARAVVSWSREESFGLSLLEGLACEVPFIAPRLPGLEELAGPSCPGVFVDDVDALVTAMVGAGAAPCPALERAARKSAERFSIDRTAVRYEELYRQKVLI